MASPGFRCSFANEIYTATECKLQEPFLTMLDMMFNKEQNLDACDLPLPAGRRNESTLTAMLPGSKKDTINLIFSV